MLSIHKTTYSKINGAYNPNTDYDDNTYDYNVYKKELNDYDVIVFDSGLDLITCSKSIIIDLNYFKNHSYFYQTYDCNNGENSYFVFSKVPLSYEKLIESQPVYESEHLKDCDIDITLIFDIKNEHKTEDDTVGFCTSNCNFNYVQVYHFCSHYMSEEDICLYNIHEENFEPVHFNKVVFT